MRAIEAADGRVLESDPLTNTLVALVPSTALRALARRDDVRAVEPAPREKPLVAAGLGLTTTAVGAPSFWAAGYTGGSGASDASSIDLAIINDKIQQDHPAFAGIDFQTPSGRGTSSTDDHGPAVASLAISRGASGCGKCVADDADRKGIAPGLDTVLDAEPTNANAYSWALGVRQALDTDGNELAGAADPAEVMNDSHGSRATDDDGVVLQNIDAYSATFGTTIAMGAGNEGPATGTVAEPCIAYNSLCMGAFSYWGTEDPADDRIPDFSSRGPSPAGRKKPDLVAVGVTQYAERRWADADKGLWSWDQEGTSFASPQGAGAAALLAGSGLTDPNMQKAVLINSARQGRSAPDQAMGTQTGWQPDWGWGALNLDAALQERTNGVGSEVAGGSARFFRASGVTTADRATLVWQRRANGCYQPGCYPSAMTLTNLDLEQLDPTTGAVQAQSNSAIDNVEQVRSPGGAATAIYKVRASSSVDGLPAEPFAVTARRQLTPLATPQPAVTVDVAAGTQRANESATVTATVRNPSADLTAENAGVALELPAGVELTSGAQTRSLGTLAASSSTQSFTWTVRGTADGLKNVIARAQASRYGETFTSTAADSYTVDATSPVPTIASPAATTADRQLSLAWGATDAHSGIAGYDVELATDGGAWAPWLTATTQTQATHTGAPGHRYRFRVRATDSLGNVSAWVESAETAVSDPPPPGGDSGTTPTPPPPPTRTTPKLTLAAVKRTRHGISMSGRIDASATGRVLVRYRVKVGRKAYNSSFVAAKIKRGRFRATLKLVARARRTRRGTLEIRYGGDSHFAARTLKRTVTAR